MDVTMVRLFWREPRVRGSPRPWSPAAARAGTAPALPQHCSRRHHQPLAHRITALARPGRWTPVPVATAAPPPGLDQDRSLTPKEPYPWDNQA
jgi:hypothetical protein